MQQRKVIKGPRSSVCLSLISPKGRIALREDHAREVAGPRGGGGGGGGGGGLQKTPNKVVGSSVVSSTQLASGVTPSYSDISRS